jgi:hypothetical protein
MFKDGDSNPNFYPEKVTADLDDITMTPIRHGSGHHHKC